MKSFIAEHDKSFITSGTRAPLQYESKMLLTWHNLVLKMAEKNHQSFPYLFTVV